MTCNNPFSDASIPSFEQVREQIASDYSIPHQRRMDLVSALNVLGKWFGLPLSMIPANAEFLRQKFKNFHHVQAGVSRRRVQNVKSLALRAMRTVGLSTKLAPYQSTMTKAWQDRYDALPDCYARTALSRFMRFSSKQGILPCAVDDAVLAFFLVALAESRLIKHRKGHPQTF